MFIIDFDDTLFNTRPGFRDARAQALAEVGVSDELYQATYLKARNGSDGLVHYDDRRHAQVLAAEGFDEEKMFAALSSTVTPDKLKEFLFDDAISFLETLRSFGEPMVLLSLGDPDYQYLKIKRLDLEKYFDRVFMVSAPKKTVMAELLGAVSDTTIWFVNDKINETIELATAFPRLLPILKQASIFPEADYANSGLPHFKTLTEIQNYIAKWRQAVPVVLAAGEGKRMQSDTPKVMHLVKKQPMIGEVVGALELAGLGKPVVVVSGRHSQVQDFLGTRASYAVQSEPLGTAHAVAAAQTSLANGVEHVLVTYGDMPFISFNSFRKLLQKHIWSQSDVTLATAEPESFAGQLASLADFGRVVRSPQGQIQKIVEKKDASPPELAIHEVNTGVYCFGARWLREALTKVGNANAQGEYYLTDVIELAINENKKIASVAIDPHEALGINTKEHLDLAQNL